MRGLPKRNSLSQPTIVSVFKQTQIRSKNKYAVNKGDASKHTEQCCRDTGAPGEGGAEGGRKGLFHAAG